MSDDIPYRPRRRRSMDTLSTLDMPTPPYGLVDPTYRPGSIRSIPVPSGGKNPSSPMRSGYRMRVGKLEIRLADRWKSVVRNVQILDFDEGDRSLSAEMTALVALFEDAIKRGHTILSWIRPFHNKESFPDVDELYRRLNTLWNLCVTVGAALCEFEGIMPQRQIKFLSEDMSWIRDSLLPDAIEKAQQQGLSDAIRAASGGLPTPTAQQRKMVESLAKDMNKEHGEELDLVTWSLTDFDFMGRLERFDE